MISSPPLVDERSAAFSRLAARIVDTLNDAVEKRKEEGETLSDIAEKMGCHRSSLSRVLNGTSRNITVRTIADILWATEFEPRDFEADPIETLCANWTGDANSYLVDGDFYYVLPLYEVDESERMVKSPETKVKPIHIDQVAL